MTVISLMQREQIEAGTDIARRVDSLRNADVSMPVTVPGYLLDREYSHILAR